MKLILISLLIWPTLLISADEVRNGGHYIEMEFHRIASEVLYVLKKPGVKILKKEQLKEFEAALKVRVVVRKGPVRDSTNAKVDAKLEFDHRGKPVQYVLDEDRWDKILKENPLTHQLVFHEILRYILRGTDQYKVENNYFISRQIRYGEAGVQLSVFNRNPQNTIYTKPALQGTKIKRQLCHSDSKRGGTMKKMVIRYYMKKDEVVDIAAVKIFWGDNNATNEKMTNHTKWLPPKSYVNKISKFIWRNGYGTGELRLDIGGDTGDLELYFHHDDDGFGVMTYLYTDGPRVVGFHRCTDLAD